ncbi:IclR family transcriptional regulator [Rhabdobacter roseus]|uniref:DNA-binding IclR family transcriptional regulator n=1 Tax=Rhabdobacter roseus TaxID=1655419 RepID=A0A840U568_9BACT|nr:IclR family transcriptional regulator [Rhabdobacter roseus]MBB5287230.1 DNA-binding IclR family transcriptional regulator [Rhabdobacter roseus]
MVLVIIKAIDILEYLAQDQERAFTLTEISESLELNQATCANILKTLVSKNFVEHLGRKKGYRLGPMAFNLTNNLSYNQNLIMAAKDVMEDLTTLLNETSLLGTLRNQKRYILHLVNSDQDLQVRSRTERNVYETATGRLLLAYLSKKERDSFLMSNGLPTPEVWKEATSPEGLEKELQKIVQDELVITYSVKHIVGFAVPIRKNEKVIAALGIFLPEIRCPAPRKKQLVQALKQAADKINKRLTEGT